MLGQIEGFRLMEFAKFESKGRRPNSIRTGSSRTEAACPEARTKKAHLGDPNNS